MMVLLHDALMQAGAGFLEIGVVLAAIGWVFDKLGLPYPRTAHSLLTFAAILAGVVLWSVPIA